MPAAGASWTSFSKALFDAVFPRKCPLCETIGEPSPCAGCREQMVPNEPIERRSTGLLTFRVAIYPYDGRAAQAVRRLKYSRCTSLTPFMAGEISAWKAKLGLDPDLVIPVPIHWSRRCTRGFNQAELLCDSLVATKNDLARVRRTRPQVGLSESERLTNLQGAFRASAKVAGKRILLVDDVLTSGQTARECARALRDAGAAEVGIIAFCGQP